MDIFRSPDNPIIKPEDVQPSNENLRVIGGSQANIYTNTLLKHIAAAGSVYSKINSRDLLVNSKW